MAGLSRIVLPLALCLALTLFPCADAKPARAGPRAAPRSGQKHKLDLSANPAGIVVFTRFNCAFPFCPTTSLDVCSQAEHFTGTRPTILATLIPFTTTADMNFLAYSDFDNTTRLHYTLAARPGGLNQLFTVSIAPNGTSGSLVNQVTVLFPDNLVQGSITYLFTYKGLVYVSFQEGYLASFSPKTGAVLNVTQLLSPTSGLVDSLACSFDPVTGTFYANAQGGTGFFLHTYQVGSGKTTMVGPLPPAAGTAGPGNTRVDNALASMVVYQPASVGGGLRLMEMRNSELSPFLFMAWLDPATGDSTLMPLDVDWWQDWELDPMIFTDQWPGSTHRVWSYDPVNNIAIFKLYDECGGMSDDCDEDDSIVALTWVPPAWVGFNVLVEPTEPQLTQLTWVWTDVVH